MPNGEGLDSWTTLPKEPFNITNVKEPLNAVSKTGSEAECLRSTGEYWKILSGEGIIMKLPTI